MSTSIYDFEVKPIAGAPHKLETFKGTVMLIVNVASNQYTPQYTGLEALYKKYKDQPFVILGFPCNQFGSQEPGKDEEIVEFCSRNYGVSFPIHSKIDVNGDGAHPLYKYLKSQQAGIFGTEFIKWNFTKFLVDKEGKVVKRYSPGDTPEAIDKDVNVLLTGGKL